MSHRADSSFFEKKRDWSRRKDGILDHYLKPYMAKIARLRRPILLVDGFAGPGKFDDGDAGSPLLLCRHALASNQKHSHANVLCIESDPEVHRRLAENLSEFDFAEARHGTFSKQLREIANLARSRTVFLYVDPYAIVGLDWASMEHVFREIRNSNASVEILLNFNAVAFVRGGLSALSKAPPSIDFGAEDTSAEQIETVSAENLDVAVGGRWWRDILATEPEFSRQVQLIVEGVADHLKAYFQEVGYVPIRRVENDDRAKYYMIFASRHPDALELMNNEMWKARQVNRTTMDLLAETEIPSLILSLASDRIARGELITEVIRREFCRLRRADIRQHIENLLKQEKLKSATGHWKINDEVLVWAEDSLF